jgi:LPXTG-motif cell wall-anchored protein
MAPGGAQNLRGAQKLRWPESAPPCGDCHQTALELLRLGVYCEVQHRCVVGSPATRRKQVQLMKHPLVRVAAVAALLIPLGPGVASAGQEFSTNPVSVADTNIAPAGQPQLLSVTVGHHVGFDRVVFTFDKHIPGYKVNFVGQIVQDASGEPIAVAGKAFIRVVFTSVASAQVGAPPAPQGRQKPNFEQLREVVGAGDFEGYVSFGLGLAHKAGFRVNTLTAPDRVVVDVQIPTTLPATGSDHGMLLLGGLAALLLGSALVRLARRRDSVTIG